MGVIESVRGVLWARRRRPEDVAYGLSLGHERFGPPELIEPAVATQAPAIIAAYRRACEQAGRPAGEIILQGPAAWADTDEAALAGSREWKATLRPEAYRDDVHDPVAIQALGRDVSDEKFTAMALVTSDPDHHVRKIQAIEQLGATAVVLMNVSGSDPLGTVRTYGESVLPALRG